MSQLNKYVAQEKGLTLVELLAVLILMSIITIFITTLVIQSFETTNEVRSESALRDEADMMISKLMKKLYETNQTSIIKNVTDDNNSYLLLSKDPSKCKKNNQGEWIFDSSCNATLMKVGFVTTGGSTKLYLEDQDTNSSEIYEVTNKNISLLKDSKIIGDPGVGTTYEVLLKLAYHSTRGGNEITKQLAFKNTLQPF